MTRDISGDWAVGVAGRLRGKDDVNRLAIALGPVRSIIRCVDSSTPPMAVDWAAVGQDERGSPLSQSHTDFRGARIAINPLPVLEDRLDPADQIDVCVGQALHEAFHSKHSRDIWLRTLIKQDQFLDVPAFEPLRVAVWLLNVAEDPRIEGLGTADWPGFRPYVDRLLDWLWDEQARHGLTGVPDEVGHTVAERMRVAFLGARYPGRVTGSSEAAQEALWWADWRQAYADGRVDAPGTVQAGLDRLGQDPAVGREMAEMAAKDEQERRAAETLRQMIERLVAEGVEGAPDACSSRGAEQSVLTEEEAEQVRELVREGLRTVEPVIRARGSRQPAVRVRRPVETAGSRRAYIGRPDPLTEAVRAALVFRQERPRHDVKLQRSGELDDEELWRFAAGDDRLFTERVVEARPDTALGMLVDISGSMLNGGRLARAQRLAQILLVAAMDTEGVTPWVWAHTGDSDAGEGADVFTIWEPGDPATRLGLLGSLDNGNNYDGHSLAVVVGEMAQREQPQKVVLVLSDGQPAGSNYGGAEAFAHMRQVCRWAESQGVSVISIAVDGGLRPADQAAMYDHWLPFTSDRQLPRDLAALLRRIV